MNNELSHVWSRIQSSLFPFLREELDPMTEKQQRLVMIFETLQVERLVRDYGRGWVGRPPADRQAIARAFTAKAFYNMNSTTELVERLRTDRNLRRICGWERRDEVPDEATFSRAFAELAQLNLPEQIHAALIAKYETPRVVGHISRDSTQIEAREKPRKKPHAKKQDQSKKRKRGRPKKGEKIEPKAPSLIERQSKMTLSQMLKTLPRDCDHGTKRNAQGHQHSWNGYKLHIDTADGEIPVSAILTSASAHDSQVAIPLATMTAQRVSSFYDLMDAAYDSQLIKAHSLSLGHVPIIDSNPRRGEKMEMDPATKVRYRERTSAERVNARFKDEFGGPKVRVRGPEKVMAHLMFGIAVLAADQLLRLVV